MKIDRAKVLIGIFVGALCLGLVVFRVLNVHIHNEQVVKETAQTKQLMAGDTIELNDDGEIVDGGYDSGYGFVGTIKLTVDSPEFYNSLNEASIQRTPDVSPSDLGVQDPMYMVVHLRVENIDAKGYTTEYLRNTEAKLEPYPFIFLTLR